MLKQGTFVSSWDSDEVISTPATLDLHTGAIEAEVSPVSPKGSLIEEYFEEDEGKQYNVCPECHNYILKTTMEEGVGKHLHEITKCTDEDCTYYEGL